MNIGDWKALGETAGSLDSGLSGLGVDVLGDSLQKMSAAITLSSGVAELAALSVSLMQRENMQKTAEAVATASAMSVIPGIGQVSVGLAFASMAIVGASVGALLTYSLRADLSSPSGNTALGQQLGAVV